MTGCVFAASLVFRELKMAVISLCCLTEAVFIEFHNTLSECSAGAELTQEVTHTWLIFLAEERYQ